MPSEIVKQREKDLKKLSDRFYNKFLTENIGKRHKVLVEEFKDGYSVGYTENYAYVYIDKQLESGIYTVKALSIFKDGLLCELI